MSALALVPPDQELALLLVNETPLPALVQHDGGLHALVLDRDVRVNLHSTSPLRRDKADRHMEDYMPCSQDAVLDKYTDHSQHLHLDIEPVRYPSHQSLSASS